MNLYKKHVYIDTFSLKQVVYFHFFKAHQFKKPPKVLFILKFLIYTHVIWKEETITQNSYNLIGIYIYLRYI